MTLFFNLQVLEEDTKCDPNYMVKALYDFHKGITIPKNSKQQYKPLKRLTIGKSFILNPESFFNDKSVDSVYKSQYIRLAGRRDFNLYKQYGIKSLDLTLYPDLDLTAIKSNPLLTIANKQITFKHEEITNGIKL